MLQIEIIQPDRLPRFNLNQDIHKVLSLKGIEDRNIHFENVKGADIGIVSSFHLKQLYKNENFSEIERIGKKILIIDNIHEHFDVTDLENISKYLEKKPIVLGCNILLYNSDLCHSPQKEFSIFQFYDVLYKTEFKENRNYDIVSFNKSLRPYRNELLSKLKDKKREFDAITYIDFEDEFFKKDNNNFEFISEREGPYFKICHAIGNSHMNIYSESMFSQKNTNFQNIKVTEKTYWPLLTGTPFLSFEYNNDKIEYLKKFGYYTFDDLNIIQAENLDYEKTIEILKSKIDYIYSIDLIEYFNNNIMHCKSNHILTRNILETYNFKEDFLKILNNEFN